ERSSEQDSGHRIRGREYMNEGVGVVFQGEQRSVVGCHYSGRSAEDMQVRLGRRSPDADSAGCANKKLIGARRSKVRLGGICPDKCAIVPGFGAVRGGDGVN